MNAWQRSYVDGLREIADFLDEHPELIPEHTSLDIALFVLSRGEFVQLGRSLGGMRSKQPLGSFYEIARPFGPHKVSVNVARDQVCRKVVTGTREVPAKEARVEEVFEWVCDDPVILGMAS